MRKTALALLLLLIPLLAFATELENLQVGDEIDDEGWHIKVHRIYRDQSALLYVQLDFSNETQYKQLDLEENYLFDGIYINLTKAFYDPEPEKSFVTLKTEVIWKNTCEKDEDCDDSDSCTIDYCNGYPLSCDYTDSHFTITYCMNDDGCCQLGSGCRWSNDNDCPQHPCDEDSDCNDYNRETNDTCHVSSGICEFIQKTECKTGDHICPDNCTYSEKHVPNRDLDCDEDSECIAHADCDDNDSTTTDTCTALPLASTNPKKCVYGINTTWTEPEEPEPTQGPTPAKKKYTFNIPEKASDVDINNIFSGDKRTRILIVLSVILGVGVLTYLLIVFQKFKP